MIIAVGPTDFMHWVKSVRIRSFFGPHSPAFGQNMDIYPANLRILSECGKMRTRKTPNTDTFYAVMVSCTAHIRGKFRTLSSIYDVVFCENN